MDAKHSIHKKKLKELILNKSPRGTVSPEKEVILTFLENIPGCLRSLESGILENELHLKTQTSRSKDLCPTETRQTTESYPWHKGLLSSHVFPAILGVEQKEELSVPKI